MHKVQGQDSEELRRAIKVVIRICKSKMNRQHNGQNKKDKQRSQNITHKTKDRVKQTPLRTGSELRCSGRVSSVYDKWDISVIICDTDVP